MAIYILANGNVDFLGFNTRQELGPLVVVELWNCQPDGLTQFYYKTED